MLVKTKDKLCKELNKIRVKGETVGLVPTMGALHQGHLSLVKRAVADNKIVVVSIFVNPTQFNDKSDLSRYPRNLNADLKLLEDSGCSIVFAPDTNEIYPEPDTRTFDFGDLDKVMEGKHRKGHFNGVAQIVSILFELIKPDRAYFGLKDFQQLVIIKKLVKMLNLQTEIVPCPIIREPDGLAMSSRNELLSDEERKNAPFIYEILQEANNQTGKKSVKELINWVINKINSNTYLTVDYFEIVNDKNLQPVTSWEDDCKKVACIAVFCGKIRLIDNYFLN
ncbi:MAG: pantoate--beta-alanine ligase [Prolixibacteraceae bacterium]|nr:pantoate--beta-alanine ligase [Prolixibacteraceae bacterium]MDD4754718.1 pantoate--beta-alanine ligase [Prolixibacteraceae bacterium]